MLCVQIETPNSDYPDPQPLRMLRVACSCMSILCSILFVGIMINLILYFISRTPKDPKFELESASFTSLEDVIGPNRTVKFDITFTVTNPNMKHNISYDTIVVSLDNSFDCEYPFDCSGFLASTRLAPFSQLSRSKNKLLVQINVADQSMSDNIVAARARRARRSIEFGLKLYARYNISDDQRTSMSMSMSMSMDFYCKHMSFVFESNNATFASGSCLNNPEIYFYYLGRQHNDRKG